MTMIVKVCDCVHPYQDSILGKFKRWMNSKLKSGEFKCTVCGKVYK